MRYPNMLSFSKVIYIDFGVKILGHIIPNFFS